jgi:hypothetical protein
MFPGHTLMILATQRSRSAQKRLGIAAALSASGSDKINLL